MEQLEMFPDPAAPDLEKMYFEAEVRPEFRDDALLLSKRMRANQSLYQQIYRVLPKLCSWTTPGLIHAMEAGCDLKRSVRNGALLPPDISWIEDAFSAFEHSAWCKDSLDFIERWNGLGYRRQQICSPYLWSGTQFYTKGKFVADGKFDPEAVSKQPGAVAILKVLGEDL